MITIQKFITEDDVNYYKSKTNDEIKKMFENDKAREWYGLPDGDLDVLLEQFRENGFTKYCRINNWRYSFTRILNNDGKINGYQTWLASFRYINKWNQESEPHKYRIITDDNMKILWIGRDNDECYFISIGENIYCLGYWHQHITLFPNISSADEYFSEEDKASNDQLIIKYRNNMGCKGIRSLDNAKYIFQEEKKGIMVSLDDYFEKGFFYKGIKWSPGYECMSKDITILVHIRARENLFYIEIENTTYPHYGYILLDLNEFRIIEAKKIENYYSPSV